MVFSEKRKRDNKDNKILNKISITEDYSCVKKECNDKEICKKESNEKENKKNLKNELDFTIEYADIGFDKFSILKIITNKNLENEILSRHIIICLDTSTSSLDKENGVSKIEILKNILVRLLMEMNKLLENYRKFKFFLTLLTFNDKVYTLAEKLEICNNNVSGLIDRILKINVSGLTNYEKLIKHLDRLLKRHDNTNTINIIISDGNITYGETDIKKLRDELSLVKPNIYYSIRHELIGFGKEQNSILLYKLSKLSNCSYYAMDEISKVNIIFGEIFQDIRKTFLVDIQIKLSNDGLIYDYKIGEWKNVLNINYMLEESEKRFSIVGNKINIEIKYSKYDNKKEGIISILKYYNNTERNSLIKGVNIYKFRQKILECMNIVKKEISCKNGYFNESDINEDELLKIKYYLNEIMIESNLENDSYCKRLLDDINVAIYSYKIGNSYSYMNLVTRLVNLGSERIYNMNNLETLKNLSKKKEKENNFIRNEFGNIYNIKNEADELLIKMEYFNKKMNVKEECNQISSISKSSS